MKVAFVGDRCSPFLERLRRGLEAALVERGNELVEPLEEARIIVNSTHAACPRPNYLRQSADTFVLTLAEADEPAPDPRRQGYLALARTLSNLALYIEQREGAAHGWLVTPELGFSRLPLTDDCGRVLADKMLALAGARLAIENELVADLPRELWQGDHITRAMRRVGEELDKLGLLPTVLPVRELLPEREWRLVMKLFGLKQASYGNLSARRDATSFWMTGRGVDKGRLERIGRDIVLVSGFERQTGRVRVSLPPDHDPEVRVSVDAAEHHQIYQYLPGVGAIIHVHAWVEGIPSTQQSWPCGSLELADEALELLRGAERPEAAVVGLTNHGITATGPDIQTVFGSLEGRLIRQVPMS